MLAKGQFVISIDHEFAWGYADHELSLQDEKRIREEALIVRRLLTLFETYSVPVTWAIVGHLIDRECSWSEDGIPHPEYPRPIYKQEKKDWFQHHPAKGDYANTLWFDAENILSLIRSNSAGHDVASHSYAHILYDEHNTHEEAIRADLKNLGRVHHIHNIPLASFVFPRNVEGYHRHLKVNGFSNYRGNSRKWYDAYPGWGKRLARLVDYYVPLGRTSSACRSLHGLINIPDSMLLLGRNGLRKLVTKGTMVRKAKYGIKRAIEEKEVFHLWFHPSNFSYDTDTQFKILEKILQEATQKRDEGKLEIMTMEQIANRCITYESDHS